MSKLISLVVSLSIVFCGLLFTTSCTESEISEPLTEAEELASLTSQVEDGITIIIRREAYELTTEKDSIIFYIAEDKETGITSWQFGGMQIQNQMNVDFEFYAHFSSQGPPTTGTYTLDRVSYQIENDEEIINEGSLLKDEVEIIELTDTRVKGVVRKVKDGDDDTPIYVVFNLPVYYQEVVSIPPFELANGLVGLRLNKDAERPSKVAGYWTFIPDGSTIVTNDAGNTTWSSYQSLYQDFWMKMEFEMEGEPAIGTYPITFLEYPIPNSFDIPGLVDISNIPAENIDLVANVTAIDTDNKTYTALVDGTITDEAGTDHFFEVEAKELSYFFD